MNSNAHCKNENRTPSKAERRAEHNAIERARRENLNSKFQQLAHALPNLQNDRRPSKGTIIERTLDYGNSRYMQNTMYTSDFCISSSAEYDGQRRALSISDPRTTEGEQANETTTQETS